VPSKLLLSLRHRAWLFAALAGACAALAASALAFQSHRASRLRHTAPPTHAHFSVFRRPHARTRSRIATVTPAGTLAATQTSAEGADEIYVRAEPGEYCLIDVRSTGSKAEACGERDVVGAEGLDLEFKGQNVAPTVALLVPDGVTSATYVDSNGAAVVAKVTNNVAVVSDWGVASVDYVMPNGEPRSLPIHSTPTGVGFGE
jgi:hypothetical protein